MITIFTPDCNTISQKTYDRIISSLELMQISCSCGHSGCLTKHARYARRIKCGGGTRTIRILRLRCSCCKRTHALLLSCIVPYSQVLLSDQLIIISSCSAPESRKAFLQRIPDLEEPNVYQILTRYRKHWKQRLISEGISLTPHRSLILRCFSSFHRQFMQIRGGINILQAVPT